MVIDKLFPNGLEDKHQNFTTTSKRFKEDLYLAVQNLLPDHKVLNAVEYGTHKGQTTRVLADLFSRVFTFNLPNHFDSAKELNRDMTNIEYIGLDLYNSDVYECLIEEQISLFFIDAVHSYDAVMSDFTRSLNVGQPLPDNCYFVFDDYGAWPEVKQSVNDLIWVEKLQKIQYIGYEPGYDFGSGRKLHDWEGIICKLIN